MWLRILCTLWATASTAALAAPQGLDVVLSQRQSAPPNEEGTHAGYFYTFWSDGTTNATYKNVGPGSYAVEWSGGEVYCGQGWKPGISE